MATIVESIGTAGDDTTIQGWENGLPANLVTDGNIYQGECKAEAFSDQTYLDGHTADATHYYRLTSADGAEHDGRPHAVSAAGNARVSTTGTNMYPMLVSDEYVRVDWMEFQQLGDARRECIYFHSVAACDIYVHHNIIHGAFASGEASQHTGIRVNDADATFKIYRNIICARDLDGIWAGAGAAGSAILCNTIYQCNTGSAASGGINCDDADFLIENNACFDNTTKDIADTTGTLDYNATHDTTGDDEGEHGIANLTTANQFVNPTTTWAETDLLVKAGADLIGAGNSGYSTATYPEIDVPISTRGTTITGAWDIGADQYVGAPPPSGIPAHSDYYFRMRGQ